MYYILHTISNAFIINFLKCLKEPVFLEYSSCARTMLSHLPALLIEFSCGSFLDNNT